MRPANQSDAKMSEAQRRKIFATAKELEIDNESLHNLVFNITFKVSLADLTIKDAINVINYMEQLKNGGNNNAPGMATDKQLWKIYDYEEKLGWKDNSNRLKAYMKKITKVESEKWLTLTKASALIEALKYLYEGMGSNAK